MNIKVNFTGDFRQKTKKKKNLHIHFGLPSQSCVSRKFPKQKSKRERAAFAAVPINLLATDFTGKPKVVSDTRRDFKFHD